MKQYGDGCFQARVSSLPHKHRVLICASAVTRISPLLKHLAADDPEINIERAEHVLAVVWRWLELGCDERDELLRLLPEIRNLAPEESISPAGFADACAEAHLCALAATVEVLLNVRSTAFGTVIKTVVDSVWQFVIAETYADSIVIIDSPQIREPEAWKDYRIQAELNRLVRDISEIEKSSLAGARPDTRMFKERAESEDAFDLSSFEWPA